MKKTIAISFLLFANMIILAHTVVFHHHFDDIQSVERCNHSHCHGSAESCSLTTLYFRLDENKPIIQSHNFEFNLLPCVLTLFSDYSILPIANDIGLPFRQKPYLLFYPTEFIARSIGRRAPPFFN